MTVKDFLSRKDVDKVAQVLLNKGFGEDEKWLDKEDVDLFRRTFFPECRNIGEIGQYNGLSGVQYQILFRDDVAWAGKAVKVVRLPQEDLSERFKALNPKPLPWKK